MGLMSGSTSYSALEKKYKGMDAPTYAVKVDGADLGKSCDCLFSEITVDLTSGFESSGASFTVIDEYDAEKSDFKKGSAADKIQVGAKVEIELGYIKTVMVFSGFIAEVEYAWDEDGTPEIRANCADAKVLMMKSQRVEILAEKKLTAAINAILGQAPASSYLKGKKVDSLPVEGEMMRLPLESDYDFLVRYAEYTGCEFFIMEGKAYFRKIPASGSVIMTLEPGQGLISATASMRCEKLIDQVKVVGIDPHKGTPIDGASKAKGKFSKGASAKKAMASTVRTVFDETIKSAGDAKARAEAIMADMHKDFMVLTCNCQGIPELVPGRSVKIKGLSKAVDKAWYIEKVRHTVDDRGFQTTIEARDNKL